MRIKLPARLQAHKPADSGTAVGNGARFCSFQDVTLRTLKQGTSGDVEFSCARVVQAGGWSRGDLNVRLNQTNCELQMTTEAEKK